MTTEVAGPEEHSELPPSSADKWFHCHAWRRQVAGIEDTSSAAADEGTLAHEWLAEHLLGRRDLAKLDNEEMYDHLISVAEWVNDQPGELHVEVKLDFGAAFGFVDLTGTVHQDEASGGIDTMSLSDHAPIEVELAWP